MAPPAMLLSVLFMIMIAMSSAESDILENSGFESPPTNITANSTTAFVLLTEANSIPGWEFSGTVWYVTSGPNISLPGNGGHAVQLGKGGKINQMFIKNDWYVEYVVTFTLAPPTEECSNKSMGVKVSSPHKSSVFFFKGGPYGRELWESHAFALGRWIDGSTKTASVDFESVSEEEGDADPIVTCWPLLDTVLLTRIGGLSSDHDMVNGGFEEGPTFVSNSSEGILLDEYPAEQASAVEEWKATRVVKYIDSKHYAVPQGKAAIQLLSGAIETTRGLSKGIKYTLGFIIGDANDSCEAEFVVYVQAGLIKQKFTMHSNGTGSAQQYYMRFKAISVVNTISFQSFNESKTSDGVFCGPVIDKVTLRASYGFRLNLNNKISVLCFFLTYVLVGNFV